MMPELKPMEVIMKIDFAESNGLDIVAHAEKVSELVRCRDCYAYRRDAELAKAACLDPEYYCALLQCEFRPDGFCSYGRRLTDDKNERD